MCHHTSVKQIEEGAGDSRQRGREERGGRGEWIASRHRGRGESGAWRGILRARGTPWTL